MESRTYNRWSNYETWAVALWLDNDQALYEHTRELTQRAWQDALTGGHMQAWDFTQREAAACRLAEVLRDFIEEQNPVTVASLYADLMNAAFCEVNWHEVAESYIDELVSDMEQTKKNRGGNS
jgi:hypothetical protein